MAFLIAAEQPQKGVTEALSFVGVLVGIYHEQNTICKWKIWL